MEFAKNAAPLLYSVLHEEWPDHAKVFTVLVSHGDVPLGTGTGKTKKAAEQAAAQKALEALS